MPLTSGALPLKKPLIVTLGVLLLAVLLPLGVAAWALARALDEAPASVVQAHSTQATAVSLHRLLDRQKIKTVIQGQPARIEWPAAELSSAWNDILKRTFQGAGFIDHGTGSATIYAALPTDRTPLRALSALGAWLNVSLAIAQTPEGPPSLTHVQVGQLPVPPGMAWWLLDLALHDQPGAQELMRIAHDTVLQVELGAQRVAVQVHWRDDLQSRTILTMVPPDDRPRLTAYQAALTRLLAPPPQATGWERFQPVPLIKVLPPLFELAQQRSMGAIMSGKDLQEPDLAARENRAALLSVSLYVLQNAMGKPTHPAEPHRMLLLHQREDFALHFVVSALVASDIGGRLTDIIGTYKEMSDETDGSGFSFNDLAADRAGVLFGQRSQHDAINLQLKASQAREDVDLMPDVADLPEYLTPEQFRAQYGNTGSATYRSMMDSIEERVRRSAVLN